MIFEKSKLLGSFTIKLEKKEDERGFFSRTWDKNEIEKMGMNSQIVQCNISSTKEKGTIRGFHYQIKPHSENKLIRCTKGKIYSVIIDLRKESSTYLQWEGIELSSTNYLQRYVPEGFANGFQSLEDNSEIFYQVSEYYTPSMEKGIRWNDPLFKIKWPEKITTISEKDKSWSDFLD